MPEAPQGGTRDREPGPEEETAVEHRLDGTPDEEGTCCTFGLRLFNKKPSWKGGSLWAWLMWLISWWWAPKPVRVRVTAVTGTTLLDTYVDTWQETLNLPSSVIWEPGQGLPLPWGDPVDGEIDQSFLLSLGPSPTGLKKVRVETLTASGAVRDAFDVAIPCTQPDEDDTGTDWTAYTSVVQGGKTVSVYLEPDECDPGLFAKTAACEITEDELLRTCVQLQTGENQYRVTLKGSAAPDADTYTWKVTGTTSAGTNFSYTENTSPATTLQTDLSMGAYTVSVLATKTVDDVVTKVLSCSTTLSLPGIQPKFTWEQDLCSKSVSLDASTTVGRTDVKAWTWTIDDASITIQPGEKTSFVPAGDGPYQVTLTATDTWDCKWSVTNTVDVGPCKASFEPIYSWCVEEINRETRHDVEVSFKNTSLACAPAYEWDFDGLGKSKAVDPVFTFPQVRHGDVHRVSLRVLDPSTSCKDEITVDVKLEQRLAPTFTQDQCSNGKVTFNTPDAKPVWTMLPVSPAPAPKKLRPPFSAVNDAWVVYCFENGAYTVRLTSTDQNGNQCSTEAPLVVERECCTLRGARRKTSPSKKIKVGNTDVEMRVVGTLWQWPKPWGSYAWARTKLQRKEGGKWKSGKISGVVLHVDFSGELYGMDMPGISFFTACRCANQFGTGNHKDKVRGNVWASDATLAAGPLHARVDSLTSNHGVKVGGVWYPMLTLSLGRHPRCAECDPPWEWIV